MTRTWLWLCALTACHPGGPITIDGLLTFHDPNQPAASVVDISANRLDDDTIVADTSTNDAMFELTLPSGDGDVYLVTSATGYLATYYNFASTLPDGVDNQPALDLFTPTTVAALYAAAGVTPQSGTGTMEVRFPSMGAVLANEPSSGVVVYDGASGQVDPAATSTGEDGTAYVLNAVSGSLSSEGSVSGKSPEIRVFPGAIMLFDVIVHHGVQ